MGQARDEEGYLSLLDAFEEPGEKIEGDLRVVLAADLLSVEIPLRKRTKGECEL